jgi:hypothetical protein
MIIFLFRNVLITSLLILNISNYSFAQEDYDSSLIRFYDVKQQCMLNHSIFLQYQYLLVGHDAPMAYSVYQYDNFREIDSTWHNLLNLNWEMSYGYYDAFFKPIPKISNNYTFFIKYYIPKDQLKKFKKYSELIHSDTIFDEEKNQYYDFHILQTSFERKEILKRVEQKVIEKIENKQKNKKNDIEDTFEIEYGMSKFYTENWRENTSATLTPYQKYLYEILDNYSDFNFEKINFKFKKANFDRTFQLDSLINNQILNYLELESLHLIDKFDTVPGYIKKLNNLKYLTIDFEREGDSGRKPIYFNPIFFNDLFRQLPKSVKSIQFEGFPRENIFIPEKYAKEFSLDSYEAGSDWYFYDFTYKHHFTPISFYFKASRVNNYNDLCYTRICKKIDENKDSVTFYYPTNTIFAKGCLSTDNKAEGKWEFYHPNGKLSEERYYLNGVETGKWNIYDPRNKLFAQFTFETDTTKLLYFNDDDMYDGTKYYEYTLFNEYTDGYIKKWNEKGEMILNKRFRRNKPLYEQY